MVVFQAGSNFSDFTSYPTSKFVDIGYPIAEVHGNGDCVVTKHQSLNGVVNIDTVRAQLLYELQGSIYLNSDVKADLSKVTVKEVGENRVLVSGTKGYPPPPTTKLAVFYRGGWQAEMWVGLTGSQFEIERKRGLIREQVHYAILKAGIKDKIDVLDFQLYGSITTRITDKCGGTLMLRIFFQAYEQDVCRLIGRCIAEFALGMQHVSGLQWSDGRTMTPKSFLVYYPALIAQNEITESVHLLNRSFEGETIFSVQPVGVHAPLAKRENYDADPRIDLSKFGATSSGTLGIVALARSGDKGGNLNVGFFVRQPDEYEWLKGLLSRQKIRQMLKYDWQDSYFIERCEFPGLLAVHFVIYGILGKGVSSSILLDSLGKGFADYLRNQHVEIPLQFLSRYGTVAQPLQPQSKL